MTRKRRTLIRPRSPSSPERPEAKADRYGARPSVANPARPPDSEPPDSTEPAEEPADSVAAEPPPAPEPPAAPEPPTTEPPPAPETLDPSDGDAPRPAHQAFPTAPPLTPMPEPPPAAPGPAAPISTSDLDVPMLDAPYTDEVGIRDDFARMEHDEPPTEDAPLSIARAVHGAHYDAAYTAPRVPEHLRRFDVVASSDDFAGAVDTAARAPDPPNSSPVPTLEPPLLPDVRFDPSAAPATPASSAWLVAGALAIGIGLVVTAMMVLGFPSLDVPEPVDDPGLGPLAPASAEPTAPEPAPVAPLTSPLRRGAPPPDRAEPLVSGGPLDATEQAAPRPAEPVVATLRVRSNKRALVWIDDEPTGLTPLELQIDPGRHTVRAMQPGQPDTAQTREVELGGDAEQRIDFKF